MSAYTNPTLADIRKRVRFYIDEPIQANFTDSDLNYAINDAQQDVITELTEVDENYLVSTTPTSITISAGTQYYPLAQDVFKIVRVIDTTTGLPIPFTDINDQNTVIPQIIPSVVYGGVGFNAVILGNSIGFTPVPTGVAFTPVYYYVPLASDLTSDTDISVIPRNYIDLVAIQAAIDARIKDEDDTTALERKYATKMRRLTQTARNRQTSTNRKVRRIQGNNSLSGLY